MRRRFFALIRVVQATCFVSALGCFMLTFNVPQTTGRINRDLFFVAHSTPRLFFAFSIALAVFGGVLELIARPLKARWASSLRGWIN